VFGTFLDFDTSHVKVYRRNPDDEGLENYNFKTSHVKVYQKPQNGRLVWI